MNESRNLLNLADTVSSKTGMDYQIVKDYIKQLFKEIEKELMNSSYVKIDNLGIFRVIKSIPNDRILFLGKFRSDEIRKTPQETEVEIAEVNADETDVSDTAESFDYDENISGQQQKDSDEFFKELLRKHSEPEKEESESNTGEEFENYYNEKYDENKKVRLSRIKIIALSVVTVILLILLLYYLYPTDNSKNNMPLTPPAVATPSYIETVNTDTFKYSHMIVAESDMDFLFLAEKFYGHEMFWPYIYLANEQNVSNPFEIKIGTSIKIPKMDSTLVNINNKASVDSAKALNNRIISQRNKTE
ncbi:MAG: HU family DNA-binding protein [Dysgonomonas sp.]